MIRRHRWQIILAICLVSLSALLYWTHYYIFKDLHHIFIYLIGDIAFVPIEVLLVTVIIHRLLEKKSKNDMLQKLNMVIGTFFNEVGTELFQYLFVFENTPEEFKQKLIITSDWPDKKFVKVGYRLRGHDFGIDVTRAPLDDIAHFLKGKRHFLLGLLGNANLLEHEQFTELLWALFHLTEELSLRADLGNLSDKDYHHLSVDMERAYALLISEWFFYMKHLKKNYPYLFSLALRTNPFNANAVVEIS